MGKTKATFADYVAARIKQERAKRKWSQQELANRAGLAIRTIASAEAGNHVNLDTLETVAEAFDIGVWNLYPPRDVIRRAAAEGPPTLRSIEGENKPGWGTQTRGQPKRRRRGKGAASSDVIG